MITLTTDFGDSAYVGAVRGSILSIQPEARLVDITHGVEKHDVQAGAFALFSAAPRFPSGTIHVAVIDPGVGTDRRGIAVKANGHTFIGPDNGVLMPVARRLGIETIVELQEGKYFREDVSATFHGRDVFGPVAAHLDVGVRLDALGPELSIDDVRMLDFGEPFIKDGIWRSSVVNVDRFGNVTTNLPGGTVLDESEFGASAVVEVNRLRFDVGLHRTYGLAPEGEPMLTIGSAGFAELSMREESFAERYGVQQGDDVRIQFFPREEPTEPRGAV